MRWPAMGPVAFAPLVEHPQDLGDLVIEETPHRHAARLPVGQVGAAGVASVRPRPVAG